MKMNKPLLACAAALAAVTAPFAVAQQDTINDYVRAMVDGFADVDETLVGDIQLEELKIDASTEFVFDIDPEKTRVSSVSIETPRSASVAETARTTPG